MLDEPAIVERVRNLLASIDLGEDSVAAAEQYLCQQGDAVSVIALLSDTEGMQKLKQSLTDVLPGYEQLSHVTLLTNEAASRGIAVPNMEFLLENGIAMSEVTPDIETADWRNNMAYGSERFEQAAANNHNVVILNDVKVPTKLVLGKDVALVLPKNPDNLDIWEGYPTHQESWLPMWFVLMRHAQPKNAEQREYVDRLAERITDEDYDLVQKALVYKAKVFMDQFAAVDTNNARKKYKNLTRILQDTLLYVDAPDGCVPDQQAYLENHQLYPLVQRANELRNGIGLDGAGEFVGTVRAIVQSYADQFIEDELSLAYDQIQAKISTHSKGEVMLLPEASIEHVEKYADLASYDLLMADDAHDKDVISIVDSITTPEFHQLVVKRGSRLGEERRVDVIAVPKDLGVWDVATGGKESYQPISMIVATHTIPETPAGQTLLERISKELPPELIAHHYLGAAEEFLHRDAWGKSFVKRIERTDLPQIKKAIPLYRVACDLLPRAIYMLKTGRLPAGVANEQLWSVGEVRKATGMIEDIFERQNASDEELMGLYETINSKMAEWFTPTDYDLFIENMGTMNQAAISGFNHSKRGIK
ncbi:hypothetical protein EOL96_05005 [Candidatus Saccharibacteria bacterium]|nr:hypothetical protein [Candidatus Saccharibacteria bacterium]